MSIRAWLVRRKIRAVFRPRELANAPQEARLKHFEVALKASESKMPGAPSDAVVETVDEGVVKGEWISVPGAREDRILMFNHGGGYVWGGPKQYRDLGARLSRAMKARVFLLDYRLSPKHKCPAAIDDALAAYDWISKNNPGVPITMAGDSAGGGLTLAATHAIRDSDRTNPVALALISPWLDVTGSGESVQANREKEVMLEADGIKIAGQVYSGELGPEDPRPSPLFGDQAGLPPTLVQVGSEEILLSDSTRFHEKAMAAGVSVHLDVWQKMHHVWHMQAGIVPEGKRAIADMAAFFEHHWGN
ncbi:alpha/beta hydrolase [Kordiimonas lipolytica]|uniref:Alpha/beta hydrolase n=1 Tax=Kordiimonas lipolytica TaxID=1662421 RepID=A0ABV8U8X4_9PROT|nr:alpha/beta hydrolase [Kordiimonas lipolytica]